MVEYDPALVEEAVLVALRGHRDEKAFRRGRDRLYELPDPEAREGAFRALHATWFEGLALGRPITQALAEQPGIACATGGCGVVRARARQEEGAELFVRPGREGAADPGRRRVVIRLRPEALRSPEGVLQFLRHEMFHIADMLDPRFGYEPSLPAPPGAPAPERLLRDRYRVLWDATIDGRLVRLGRAPAAVRAERWREFVGTFPMLGTTSEEAFAHFFDGAAPTHAALVAFVTDPTPAALPAGTGGRAPAPHAGIGPRPGERCPLCGFPTHAFAPDPHGLPPEVLGGIRRDFPVWGPERGLCQQCADLYRSRSCAPGRAGGPGMASVEKPSGAPVGMDR